MSKILLQTTIPDAADGWDVGRFSLLADELRLAGHHVVARNRDDAPEDSRLAHLDRLDFDQLWLLAVDPGDGLSERDVAGILRFRMQGRGVLTARDHDDLGSSLRCLGALGVVNHFHTHNPEVSPARDDPDNPAISWPNYHSGTNGAYQPVRAVEPVHPLMRTRETESGRIEWFPAHPHEGAVSAPEGLDAARVVAQGRSAISGRPFNLAVAIEGETSAEGEPMGRAVACSSFHHFADMNWSIHAGAPSFVSDERIDEMACDPLRFQIFKGYIRNIARWLDHAI